MPRGEQRSAGVAWSCWVQGCGIRYLRCEKLGAKHTLLPFARQSWDWGASLAARLGGWNPGSPRAWEMWCSQCLNHKPTQDGWGSWPRPLGDWGGAG